jgi:hypothetical protein
MIFTGLPAGESESWHIYCIYAAPETYVNQEDRLPGANRHWCFVNPERSPFNEENPG